MRPDIVTYLTEWIKDYFVDNGPDCRAVVGISGGKDSTVVAKLCVEALGPEKVVAVKMPQGIQHDINYANEVIDYLGIPERNILTVNIKEICDTFYKGLKATGVTLVPQITSNLPARVRMTILYAVAADYHGRVANTCNASEDYVGYATKFGDAAGDFSPLSKFTVTEVIEIGRMLGIPDKFLEKPPEDGLCGKTDEENLGFSYAELDKLLMDGVVPDYQVYKKICEMHKRNIHKLKRMPCADHIHVKFETRERRKRIDNED